MKKTRKIYKLNRIEKAILHLADLLEDPMHDQYKVRLMIMDILGLELTPPHEDKK